MDGITNIDDIDSNQWYQICTGTCGQSLFGSEVYANSASTGAAFCQVTNTSSENQRWQLLKLNSTAWTIRAQKAGANVYLGAAFSSKEETEGNTVTTMLRGDVADASVYWIPTPWGDGPWYFTNSANGTDHLLKKPNSLMAMTPNISSPAGPGQRWHIKPITAINDSAFSGVNLVGATIATASTVSGSSSATATPTSSTGANADNNAPSSSGLSTAAKAGIGAGVGGAALIALVVLGLFLWRKRKQRQPYTKPPQEMPNDMAYAPAQAQAPPLEKYELNHDATTYEMPYNNVVSEAPMNERPAELPGHAVQR